MLKNKIVESVSAWVNLAKYLTGNPNPSAAGGYMFIGRNQLMEKNIFAVGENETISPHDERLVQEPAYRLHAQWLLKPYKTFSSWQTRDIAREQYGGGILLPLKGREESGTHTIIVTSGLPEIINESSSLAAGLYLKLADEDIIRQIIQISHNDFFERLRPLLRTK